MLEKEGKYLTIERKKIFVERLHQRRTANICQANICRTLHQRRTATSKDFRSANAHVV